MIINGFEKLINEYVDSLINKVDSLINKVDAVPAPSGEFEEYNSSFLVSESNLFLLKNILNWFGWEIHYEKIDDKNFNIDFTHEEYLAIDDGELFKVERKNKQMD